MKQALRERPSLWLWFILSFGLGLFGIYLAFTDSVYTMTAVIASLFAFGFALQRTAKKMEQQND
ncbi:putative membrane protein [Exiguobacterium sp. S17]|nr:putative membrane protein [Exiguobacterium sp. S17]